VEDRAALSGRRVACVSAEIRRAASIIAAVPKRENQMAAGVVRINDPLPAA
jgi:hypothetical protein